MPHSPLQSIRSRLRGMAEESYRRFASSLLPGESAILGVRLPALRQLAREIAAGDWRAYQQSAIAGSPLFFEERMLLGLLPAYAKGLGREEYLLLLQELQPLLNNWSLCDSCCNSYRFLRREREFYWPALLAYLRSEDEFEARFGVVLMLSHYSRETAWAPRLRQALQEVRCRAYYAEMAVAWCCCELAIHAPAEAAQLLREGGLPESTRKLAFRKIRESRRAQLPNGVRP